MNKSCDVFTLTTCFCVHAFACVNAPLFALSLFRLICLLDPIGRLGSSILKHSEVHFTHTVSFWTNSAIGTERSDISKAGEFPNQIVNILTIKQGIFYITDIHEAALFKHTALYYLSLLLIK